MRTGDFHQFLSINEIYRQSIIVYNYPTRADRDNRAQLDDSDLSTREMKMTVSIYNRFQKDTYWFLFSPCYFWSYPVDSSRYHTIFECMSTLNIRIAIKLEAARTGQQGPIWTEIGLF